VVIAGTDHERASVKFILASWSSVLFALDTWLRPLNAWAGIGATIAVVVKNDRIIVRAFFTWESLL
jgi:hypothetical protein